MSEESQEAKKSNWPKDEFGRSEVFGQLWLWALLVVGVISAVLLPILVSRSRGKSNQVIVYCAQDQVYAQGIFAEFEKQTGLKIRAVYDSEATKTVGLANRLLAERAHPQCDVFWGNEEMRTWQLASQNVFRETNGWRAFGYRSRRMVINTNHLSIHSAPHSLLDLTNHTWRGKVALAYPQFGTTAAHFHALRQLWGNEEWQRWCRGLASNKPFLLDGNSMVVRMVGKGDAWAGLTDSDDIAAGQREGLPVAACPMNEETLLIPNTVAVTRNGLHPNPAQTLFDYLQTQNVAARLIAADALEGSSMSEVPVRSLKVDWPLVLHDLQAVTESLNQIFLR
jgi:iron(III) transport system substrate-binding protein